MREYRTIIFHNETQLQCSVIYIMQFRAMRDMRTFLSITREIKRKRERKRGRDVLWRMNNMTYNDKSKNTDHRCASAAKYDLSLGSVATRRMRWVKAT